MSHKVHPKIKVMSTTASEWVAVVVHARKLGAISRDGQYGFNPDKPSMIIENNYIKYSSPTMKPKAGVTAPATKISVSEFIALRSLHDAGYIGTPCTGQVMDAIASVVAITPALGENMQIAECTVLKQDAIIFKSKGIPALKELGVEVTMMNDTPYIIDIKTNSAEELTTDFVAAQAKKDALAGETTSPYVVYANMFQLFTEIKYAKVVDAE